MSDACQLSLLSPGTGSPTIFVEQRLLFESLAKLGINILVPRFSEQASRPKNAPQKQGIAHSSSCDGRTNEQPLFPQLKVEK